MCLGIRGAIKGAGSMLISLEAVLCKRNGEVNGEKAMFDVKKLEGW